MKKALYKLTILKFAVFDHIASIYLNGRTITVFKIKNMVSSNG